MFVDRDGAEHSSGVICDWCTGSVSELDESGEADPAGQLRAHDAPHGRYVRRTYRPATHLCPQTIRLKLKRGAQTVRTTSAKYRSITGRGICPRSET